METKGSIFRKRTPKELPQTNVSQEKCQPQGQVLEGKGDESLTDISPNVSTLQWDCYLKDLHQKLPSIVEGFRGGRLKQFAPNWKNFTSDKWILEGIKGCNIEFTDTRYQMWIL